MAADKNSDLISVIVPFLNEERFIGEAIASIVNQHYRPVELILVDDGSTDAGFEVAENSDFDDLAVRLLRHEENRGLPAARNTGLQAATGEYFAYLDGEDVMTPCRLDEMLDTLRSRSEVDVLIGRDELFSEPGTVPAQSMLAGRQEGVLFYPMSMIYGREVHAVVGGFDERFEACEDLDWLHRAAALGLSIEKTECIALRRRAHGSNISYDEDRLERFRVRSMHELLRRNRSGTGHYVDPCVGVPS